MHRKFTASFLVAAGMFSASLVHATENITFVYDAKGRLAQVIRTGNINSGVTTTYTHDKADNRTNVKTTGSQN